MVCGLAAISRITDAQNLDLLDLLDLLGGVLGSLIALIPQEDQNHPSAEPLPGVILVRT